MPQLKSGRHVSLSLSPYLDALASGPDEAKYFAVVALRLNAPTPEALLNHVVIGYFREGQGAPPDAPSYNSGHCVDDVLEGRTDWRPEEVEEFREFLTGPRVVPWLQIQWDGLNQAIQNCSIWSLEGGEQSFVECAIIQNSALMPNAMGQLRASWGEGPVQ